VPVLVRSRQRTRHGADHRGDADDQRRRADIQSSTDDREHSDEAREHTHEHRVDAPRSVTARLAATTHASPPRPITDR
jgi:hypothetical protein